MPRQERLSVATSVRPYGIRCTPPLWARGGHAQTLLGHLLPSPGPRLVRGTGSVHREVPLQDGDRLLVFEQPGTSGVRVHLFHGLSGDVNSDYMRRTAFALASRGHGVWLVNHRGCGEGRGLASRPYHSGRSEDLQAVLAASRRSAPDLVHLVIGFSLSGNMALLHAAEHRDPQPDCLIAVNPPLALDETSVAIGRGLNRLYEMRFMWRLRRTVREREQAGLAPRHYEVPLRMTLLQFDDMLTAPECGFASGQDYYDRCSSLGRLVDVTTPTVILSAGDDPFVDAATIQAAERSDAIDLHIEPTGGHVGYLARRGLGCQHWLDGALIHYVEELAECAR